MKKLICLLLGMYLLTGLYAQNTFTVSGGTRLVTAGNVQVVLSQGTLTNNGTISGSGTGGTWIFKGPVILTGTGSTRVANLIIDHTYGVTQLNSMISVMNTATLANGTITTNDNLFIRSDMNGVANLVVLAIPSGTIQGLVAKGSTVVGACPAFTSTLSVNISGPQITYQWQSSPDSLAWTNVSGATNNNYNATAVSGTIFYRCLLGSTGGTYHDTATATKLRLDIPDATISGATTLAPGATATLTGATTGGTWSSNNTGVLTVNATSGLITGVNSGTATITYTVTNGSGCTASKTVLIAVGAGNPSVIVTNPAAVCAPGTINLTLPAITAGSDPGLTYTYYTDAAGTNILSTPAAVTASGTYYIKGTAGSSASSGLIPVVVTINALPSGNITPATGAVLCGTGASLVLTASGGNTYAWSKDGAAIAGVSGNQLTVTATGGYTATLISAAGCQAAAANSVTVTSVQSPKAAFNFDSYCTNKPITFTNLSTVTGSGTVNYQWSDNAGNSSVVTSPAFTYTQAGTYNVKLKATPQACATAADSVTIQVPVEAPRVAIRMQPANLFITESITVSARNFGKTYLWTPATGLSDAASPNPKVTVTAEQEYKIAISVQSGCVTVDTLLVRVFDNRIYVPNVFTPNGDGINDKLFVNLVGIRELHYFRIFNRYGKEVFKTSDGTVGWDGRVNNVLQQMDTYVWTAEAVDNNGNVTIKRGTVTLLR